MDEKTSDDKTSDDKTSDEKTSDEKTSDDKTSNEKTSDDQSSDEKTSDETPAEEKPPELQKTFDTFSKIAGNNEDQLSGETAKNWMTQAGVVGNESHQISKEDVEKNLPESAKENGGGMDLKEFEDFIEDLAKEKEMDTEDIKKKLSFAVPSRQDLDQKLEDIKAKMTEEK